MFFPIYVGVLFAYMLHYYMRRYSATRNKFPPGPFPIPGIGNIINILMADKYQPGLAFKILGEKYGNIFSLQLGIVQMVVVNGREALKEVLTNDVFAQRSEDEWLLDRNGGEKIGRQNFQAGLFLSDFEYWKPTRRFYSRIMASFGFGRKKTMEALITEEFDELTQNIKKSVKLGIFRMEHTFNMTMVNIISSLITGTRYSHDDPKLIQLLRLMNEYMQSMQVGGILMAYPFMKQCFPVISGFAAQHIANTSMRSFIKEILESYRKEENYKLNPSNFVEAALQRIDLNGDFTTSQSEQNIFTDENLISIIYDLIHAGIDTTSHTLSFAVRYLVQRSNIQGRIREEVDQVIGTKRPTLEDKSRMSYTEVFILEVLRFSNVAPLAMLLTKETTTLGPYVIPKGTQILTNFYSANMDESVWGDPTVFRPERFLNNAGEIVHAEQILTFSLGKRNCLGEQVAKSTMFLGICCLIQNFEFEADGVAPGVDIVPGITQSPAPFNVLLKIRN